jgi:gp16 family phage-associated protein
MLIILFIPFPTVDPQMTKAQPPKTLDDFLSLLEAQNMTVAAWAREKGLPLGEVYSLLRGRTIGKRGAARTIVIAMGLKPPPMHKPGKPLQRTEVRARAARAAA